MTIPKRFLDDLDDSSAASKLLASGRSEVPSMRSREQALQALGIGVAAGVVGSASTAAAATAAKAGSLSTAPLAAASSVAGNGVAVAASTTAASAGGAVVAAKATLFTGATVKALLGAFAVVGVVGGGVAVSRTTSQPMPQPALQTVEVVAPVVSMPRITSAPPQPLQALPPMESTAIPLETTAPATKDTEPARAVRAPEPSTVSEELTQLDAARSALRSGDGALCLKKLDTYLATYPKGTLRFEAEVLRCEALVQSGRSAEAQTLAKRLLAQQPSGPYSARLRRLITPE